MMTPQQLKNSILQRAIEGKLVEQRPEEGNAKELLKQIKAEKDKLTKEGKIKKSKPLPPITEDEILFEIPESWEWVRLGEIAILENGDRSKKYPTEKDFCVDGIPFLGAKDMVDGYISLQNVRFITENKYDELGQGKLKDKDIVCLLRGSVGKMAIFNKTHKFKTGFICAQMLILRFVLLDIVDTYFKLLNAPCIQTVINSKVTGTAVRQLPAKELRDLIIPLIPLSEQQRIVARIEELMSLVDEYDKVYSQLTALNEKFPADMKKSILQYAIEGKLVEQRPEEGTATDLLKQIKAEKAKLTKEGKIKKEKPLPPITEDEIPFYIPEEWVWCRLGDIGDWGSGATPARVNSEYYDGDISWVKTGDLNDGYILETPEHISEIALKDTPVRLNPVGSVLMAMYGATIGKLGILSTEATTNQACCACIPFPQIYNRFLFYYLLSQRRNFTKLGAGGAQPNISRKKIVEYLFPLPPISEQKRIVSKLEQILPFADGLILDID